VSDEKDARCYLQALAAKMTDELDSLKNPTAVSTFTTFTCVPATLAKQVLF